MKRIVLVRHGESQWNKENRFTGWINVDLSEKGIKEAVQAGDEFMRLDFHFKIAFTSYLKRAIKTLNIILDVIDQDWIEVKKTWRLNEKHYGSLQGLNKAETAKKFGDQQVFIWRRSFDEAPNALSVNDQANPSNDDRYSLVPPFDLPLTESLKDTIARVIPYWECEIFPKLMIYDDILVVAHGNSLRAIVKYIKDISDSDIPTLNIPTAVPYVFEFDDNLNYVNDYYLGNEEEIKNKQDTIKNQGKG